MAGLMDHRMRAVAPSPLEEIDAPADGWPARDTNGHSYDPELDRVNGETPAGG